MKKEDIQYNVNFRSPETEMVDEMMLKAGLFNRSEFFRRLVRQEYERQNIKRRHPEQKQEQEQE